MGQRCSQPIVDKETTTWSDANHFVTATSMQGWRLHMEDSHTCLLHLPEDPNASYFSVFDGHGGTRVARFAALHLHEKITSQPEYTSGNFVEAIRNGFLTLDAEMQRTMTNQPSTVAGRESMHPATLVSKGKIVVKCKVSEPHSTAQETSSPCDELAGSTGIVVLIRDQMLYCGNAGDSRAVCCRRGVACPLSYDHKPSLREEKDRILAAGGWVEANRVNGNLALSRAFGDFVFKRNGRQTAENQIVSANPDVRVQTLLPSEDEFIVICCDGVWDVMTNQEVISFIRLRLAHGMQPSMVCEELMMRCLAPDCQTNGLGCDNMTVVLICMLNGRSFSEFQLACARPANDILHLQ